MTTRDAELDRLDALLMRVLDSEASEEERRELARLAEADDRLAGHVALRRALRAAVVDGLGDPIDVVPQVLAALGLDDGWEELAGSLQAALVDESLGVDLADEVMEAVGSRHALEIELSGLHDGELVAERRVTLAGRLGEDRELIDQLTGYADLGRHLREAIGEQARPGDLSGVWAAVAEGVGLDHPERVPGWDATAPLLREAIAARAALSPAEAGALTDQVLEALPQLTDEPQALELDETEPDELEATRGWLGVPFGTLMAVVAALLLVVPLVYDRDEPAPQEEPVELAQVDEPADGDTQALALDEGEAPDVVIESLEMGDDVLVQVMQADEEGAATVLWIDEPPDDEGATL